MHLSLSTIVIIIILIIVLLLVYSQNRKNMPKIVQPHIVINKDKPITDPIKDADLKTLYDPLTYPHQRLPREIMMQYEEYYKKTGQKVPFHESTRKLLDTPTLNGLLIRKLPEGETCCYDIPSAVPLFRVRSLQNHNRFFYYIIDLRYPSKIEIKVPLDNIKINGCYYDNADIYGVPELFDNDEIECISIYPNILFRVSLYKPYFLN